MSKKPLLLSLLLSLSLTFTLSQQQQTKFTFNGFSNSNNNNNNNLSLNGVAEIQSNGILRLTNETPRLIGHAFYPSPLQFKNSSSSSSSFSTTFAFAIVPEYPKLGGHGFAFVISPSKDLIGAQPSQYLGIFNASDISNFTNHIFAVEFDTVQDFEFFDINDNHVGIDINRLVSNYSVVAGYFDEDGKKVDLNLKSGSTIQAWVDYDGVEKMINVSLSPFSMKPMTPIMSLRYDLSPILQEKMYVGFSSSTGLLASSHYIMGWNFNMNAIAPSLDLSSLPSLDISSLQSMPQPKKKNTTLIVVALLSSFIILITAAGYVFYRIKNSDIIEQWEFECGPHRFSYKELKQATKGFRDRELLGVGGFGKVYKGTLSGSKAEVAVKRVNNGSKQGLREFVAEIASIGRLRHRNIVRLQGWCRHRADLQLVYDYMPNGSLDQWLFLDKNNTDLVLSWAQRYKILRGVASALLYLHEEWENVVLHRDVKASNVLLDGELNGRLGDFGLAKLYEHGANPATTRVVGTLGYLAPELTRTGKATTSSDVFAFGALALEIVCGRRPIEPKAQLEELVLVEWVWEKWSLGEWVEVLDPRMEKGGVDLAEAEVAVRVGLLCSHPLSDVRPSMREVVRYLDGGDAMEVPAVRLPDSVYEGVITRDHDSGIEDYVHSYPSSPFEKTEDAEGAVTSGNVSGHGGPFSSSTLSLLSRDNV